MAVADKLAELGRTAAEVGDAAVGARQRPSIEARLAAIRAARAAPPESLRRPIAVGLALGAAAAAAILWPRSPLTFAVGEPTTPGAVAAWVVAPPGRALPIAFSDGTRMQLEGGARVRVLGVTEHGARVAIERGALRAFVVPRSGNDWSVIGGPFEIHVTGTSFDAAWDPDTEVLRVRMLEGRVIVRADCLDRDRALVAGDSASLSCATPKEAARSAEPKGASSAPAANRSARPPAIAGPRPSAAHAGEAPAEPTASAAPPVSWRELARRGDYKGALVAAEAEGWGALCASLSAAELFELATTARLAGRSARAVEAYTAVRSRFAGGDAAANAAFHLGQMAFDGSRSFGVARRWFLAYLAERPGGPLAPEALGRTMEAEQRLGDLATARETARRYLARYPGGAHADLAKSLLAP